jgi:hypothetical protein
MKTNKEIAEEVLGVLTHKECCSCGTTKDLEYGPDPYSEDIHGDTTPVWECARCRHESARAI